jgi:two-component system response regulator EvgA
VEGLSVLSKVHRHYPELSVLVISGLNSALYAQRCMRLGARGFLGKEDCADLLCPTIEHLRSGQTLYPQQETQVDLLWGDLTDRELVALRCLARGSDAGSISAALRISSSNANMLCKHLQTKLGLSSPEELVGLGRHMRLG